MSALRNVHMGACEGPAPGSDMCVSAASVYDSQFHCTAFAPELNSKRGLRKLYNADNKRKHRVELSESIRMFQTFIYRARNCGRLVCL